MTTNEEHGDAEVYEACLAAAQISCPGRIVTGWVLAAESIDAEGHIVTGLVTGVGDAEIRENGTHRLPAHRTEGILRDAICWVDEHRRRLYRNHQNDAEANDDD